MRLIKNIICLTVLMVFTLFHTQISFAANSEWYWISSDDKYSKYFSELIQYHSELAAKLI